MYLDLLLCTQNGLSQTPVNFFKKEYFKKLPYMKTDTPLHKVIS